MPLSPPKRTSSSPFLLAVSQAPLLHPFTCTAGDARLAPTRTPASGPLATPLVTPQVAHCLRWIATSSEEVLQRRYGYPTLQMVAALRRRAAAMLSRGFEWTLAEGWPRNPDPLRYRWAPPCCAMRHVGSSAAGDTGFRCAPEMPGHQDLPLGDPVWGGAWTHSTPDPGKYVV